MNRIGANANAQGAIAVLWRETLVAARFGLVGLVATTVHMTVVWRLIEATQTPVLLANLIAFLTAFGVSFAGNYFWTFRSPGNPIGAMKRFFLISASAFAANTVLLASLLAAGWLSPSLAAVAAAAAIPLMTYLASRLWGFRDTEQR